ncbi:MAG TPA: hypothetical protein PLD84_02565 [Chitinophagales bacterium]|nr:hypothetical protein [Chitinophagales bacterium]
MIKAISAISTLFLLSLLLFSAAGYAQTTGTLKIQNIRLVIDGKETTSPDLTLPFEWSKDSQEFPLYKNDQFSIVAKYRLSTHKSPRSSLKSSALNVIINYYMVMNGDKDKRRSEKIFYLDQERQFNVEELFVFKEGFNNSNVKLSYTGVLSQ